jgi:UDP:flavonoid glycosyltransferase YjiC (YdhE family)
MGRDQNDNAVKVKHHGCGIGLSAKAGAGKIRKAVQRILIDDSFKKVAVSFQEMIHANKKENSIIQEIEDLVDPNEKKSLSLMPLVCHNLS